VKSRPGQYDDPVIVAYACFTHNVVVSMDWGWRRVAPRCSVASHSTAGREIHPCPKCGALLIWHQCNDRLKLRCEAAGAIRWHDPAATFWAPAGTTEVEAFQYIS